jgi:hypothetical protein
LFLSKVNYATRTLTVYEGVEYGFFVYVVDVPSRPAESCSPWAL